MSGGSASPPPGEHDTLLRFIACGSVDDGKSTLIGRLIHDTQSINEDQLVRLADDSRRFGTRGSEVDFALLLDGLAAEREQGITIDVAHHFFATERRRFIVADAPGHEQFTRNMVTGASTADAALILIDVREGPVTQTRRHSHLAHLLGIRHFLLAVNKLDLVDYDQAAFEAAVATYLDFARTAGLGSVEAVPVCAIHGDNVVTRSDKMDWYSGPTIVEHLERLPTRTEQERDAPFRMPVQWVNRPNADFRGYAGTVASGTVRLGDAVQVSGRTTRIADIVTYDGSREEAAAGDAVTLVLSDQIDCSRGDLIASSSSPPQTGEVFEATIIWMVEQEMLPGRSYLLKIGPNIVAAQLQAPKYELDPNTLEHRPARTLSLNAIGVCNLTTDRPIAWTPYAENRDLGGFLLIDRETNATAGAGLIHFALRRSDNVRWQALDVTREMHAGLKHQRPALLWFTGLSGAGKSTIANLVEKKLVALGRHTFLLDGDNLRHGLNKDLGFTDADRVENIRRAGEVAKLMTDAGLIVLAAFISPFRAERRMVREMAQAGEFVEIFVDTPLDVAERRDVKGLYRKARAGELANFTGIGSPYEAPEAPEIRIDTTGMSPEAAADRIVDWLLRREASA